MEIFNSKRAILKPIKLNETDANNFFGDYETSNEYQALLFPNFDNNSGRYENYQLDRSVNGSSANYDNKDHNNIAINSFIKKYLNIEKFNSEKGMPKEAYEIVISTYLNELSTAPYCEPQEFRKRFIPADEDLY